MNAVEDLIIKALENWNQTLTSEGHDYQVKLETKCRKKKFYLNKDGFFERRIAEISLYQVGKPTLLLWRKELLMPEKVANVPQHEIDEAYKRDLYQFFFFEIVGIFAQVTAHNLRAEDAAEYDLEKDRLRAHPAAEGMVVMVTKAGTFYELNDKFDVFYESENNYNVYTAHDMAVRNGGIASIPKTDAIVVEQAKPRILTLDQL